MSGNILFRVEQDPAILDFKNKDGVPLWLFMRNFAYETAGCHVFHDEPVRVTRSSGLGVGKYIARAMLHNMGMQLKKKKAETVFYTISREVLIEGKYYNQYTDAYSELVPENNISIVHPPLDWKWKKPRYNDNVLYSGPNQLFAAVFASLKKTRGVDVWPLMEYVAEKMKQELDVTLTDPEKEQLVRNTCYEMHKTKYHAKWLARQCRSRRTKLIVMLGGSYPWYYYLNDMLKNSGVKTADLQHGWISGTNRVYNYHENLLKDPCVQRGAPDYFLTYGQWWGGQTNIPHGKTMVVGNPYREWTLQNFTEKERDKIVLIGCSNNTRKYLELASGLQKAVGDACQVIFRPHPTERLETQKIMDEGLCVCEVDYGRNLHELLAETKVLLTEISTVLFESIGMVEKILVWKTQTSEYMFPDSPFDGFTDLESLVAQVSAEGSAKVGPEEFWDKNWKENFQKVLSDAGIGQ